MTDSDPHADQQEQPLHDLGDIEAKLRSIYFGPISRPYMERMCREIRRLQAELKGWESLGRTQRQALEAADHNEGVWRKRAERIEAENAALRKRVEELESGIRLQGGPCSEWDREVI